MPRRAVTLAKPATIRVGREVSVTRRETLSRAEDGGQALGVTGVVVVAHGGRSVSSEPTTAFQPAVLRMVPLARAIRHALRGSGAVVVRPRFRLRGWNGEQALPVHDLGGILDDIGRRFGPVPIVLVGHSMGARAALRVAGHPAVSAVAGLAPWLPPGEPVGQLAGRRVLLVQGNADAITRPDDTWAYAERARSVAEVTAVEIRHVDHAMLRRASLWHSIAAEFAGSVFRLPAGAGQLSVVIGREATDPRRAVL
jgi:pimeloyl-ACP methyl ester carboxylesterase